MSPPGEEPATTPSIARRNWKSAVTRHLATLARLVAEEDEGGVRSRLTSVRSAFESLEAAHDQFHNALTDEVSCIASEAWFLDVNTKYIQGITDARNWLKSLGSSVDSDQDDDDHTDSVASLSAAEMLSVLTLPKAEIDVFSGNPLEYQSFFAIFDECIHNKVNDDQIRLTRLLQYTSGPAKLAIKNCSLIGGTVGYQNARDILKNRFGNHHLVAQRLISDIKSGKQVHAGPELQQFADELTMALTTLKGMNMLCEIDTQQCILDILSRCPNWVRAKWRKRALDNKRDTDAYPSFEMFVDFVQTSASDSCDPLYGNMTLKSGSSSRLGACNHASVGTPGPSAANHSAPVQSRPQSGDRNSMKCVLCNQGHGLYKCEQFKSKSANDRLNIVRSNSLCFNCLFPGHRSRDCRKRRFCNVPGCFRKHNKLLHEVREPVSDDSETHPTGAGGGNVTSPVNNASASGTNGCAVRSAAANAATNTYAYLPVVEILINGRYPVFALLDSGSTNTIMSERLAAKLPPSDKRVRFEMQTINSWSDKEYQIMSISVSCLDGSNVQHFRDVLVDGEIPYARPDREIDLSEYPYLADLPLPCVGRAVEIDILIGMDNAHVQIPLEVRTGPASNLPYATRSVFGWSLCGPVPGVSGAPKKVYSHFVKLEQINQQVENLWDVEVNYGDEKSSWSSDDHKVIDLWSREMEFIDGHYCIPVPWKDGEPNMPNNEYMAMARLKNLVTRLQRTGLYDKYEENLFDLVDKKYAEPVPPDELTLDDGTVWYLPHHNVTSKSKPDKFRIVFDCAAKYSGVSLNSECLQGPDLCNKLLHVLLRFRQYKFAITADIMSMYHMVTIPENHRNCLRFLWLKDGRFSEFRMRSHLFGGRWCSASSTYALRQCVLDETCSDLVRDTVTHAFYVDDLLKAVPTFQDGIEVIHGTTATLAARGFKLTKFMTNDDALLNEIPVSDRVKETREITPELSSKALGMMWGVNDDVFYYVSKLSDNTDGPVTKRVMLSCTSSLYDPLGLIGPVVMLGKMLFQEAVRLKLSWDTEVPASLADNWNAWLLTMSAINDLKFDRCVVPDGFEQGAMELHHFCDASLTGYGACSYLRVTNHTGRVHAALIMAKSRLAPIKQLSVPRLELCAAVVAVKLDIIIRRELELELLQSTFWSDSKIILSYIRSESKRFQIFEGNRVSFIRENTSPEQWQFIPGSLNPADVASRGCMADALPDTWYTGPVFLSCHKSAWPTHTCVSDEHCDDDESEDVEHMSSVSPMIQHAVTCDTSVVPLHSLDKLITHYSSFYRLKKALCWLVRFVRYLQRKLPGCDQNILINGPITADEMRHAESVVIKHVQRESFATEIRALVNGENVLKSSRLRALDPTLKDGVLVVGGRIKHAHLNENVKHPVILPSKHQLSDMILQSYHDVAHLGTNWTLSFVQEKFWIPHARNRLKKIRRKCVTCRKLYGKPMQQKMADLPPERCKSEQRVFQNTGVDIFGPFHVRVGRSQAKRYGAIFTCFATRAVHLEVLHSMEADSFINAFLRFAARRSFPENIWCDNGTNFVGAKSELLKSMRELDRNKVIRAARQKDVQWVFNPPSASHFGGVWERLIRTVRQVMVAVLGLSPCLTDEILLTTFCEIENLVNSRPITKCNDDVNDLGPLTPNHLLLMCANESLSLGEVRDSDVYRRRWRHVRYLTTLFWRRWTRLYLSSLQKRCKWQRASPNLKNGDLVLIIDENSPRGMWPLGLVTEVNVSQDGFVRSARLKTQTTELVRPISKLVYLECSEWSRIAQLLSVVIKCIW